MGNIWIQDTYAAQALLFLRLQLHTQLLCKVNDMRNSLFTVILVITLSGCSYGLTYHSQPPGALIKHTENGNVIGMAPINVDYGNDPRFKSDGCYRVAGVTAVWVSGAQAKTENIITLCGTPQEYVITLSRPASAPDLEKDMNFAIKIQNNAILQQQANQQAQSNAIQMFNALQSTKPKTTTGTIRSLGDDALIYQETTR